MNKYRALWLGIGAALVITWFVMFYLKNTGVVSQTAWDWFGFGCIIVSGTLGFTLDRKARAVERERKQQRRESHGEAS